MRRGFLCLLPLAVACNSTSPTTSDASPSDGNVDDAPLSDGGGDSAVPDAADAEVDAGVPAVYGNPQDSKQWESFDPITFANERFSGGAFDGQYVYLLPQSPGAKLVRYDTKQPFGNSSSWALFDMSTVSPYFQGGFAGAVFANGILYPIPAGGYAARFDTTASFTSTSSYEGFNTTTILASPNTSTLFEGGAFDGRYVYPSAGGTTGFYATRYDTNAAFTSASSWTQVQVSQGNSLGGTVGAVFDGNYVYYPAAEDSNFHRYDTTKSFTDTQLAWSLYIGASGMEYAGGTYDGRYVYFAPYKGGYALRFDTTASSFSSAAGWQSTAITTTTQAEPSPHMTA